MPKLSSHPMVEFLDKKRDLITNQSKDSFLKNIMNNDFESEIIVPMDKEEDYHWNVSIDVAKLVATFNRIEIIQEFLSIPSKDIPLTNKKNSKLEWLGYHYSTYIWTIVRLSDISFILTSTIFNLGIPPKYCKDWLNISHELVSKKVKSVLKKLNKEVDKKREQRNSLLHQGNDPKIVGRNKLAVFETLSELYPDMFQSQTEFLYKDLGDSLLKVIKTESKIFESIIYDLFDALKPSYEKKYGKIKGELLQKALSNYKE